MTQLSHLSLEKSLKGEFDIFGDYAYLSDMKTDLTRGVTNYFLAGSMESDGEKCEFSFLPLDGAKLPVPLLPVFSIS